MSTRALSEFLAELGKYRHLSADELAEAQALCEGPDRDARQPAAELIRRGRLTPFQANHVLSGRADRLVLGPYVLLERLGQGGMGQVFKARHALMDRIVALKVLREDLLRRHPSVVDRFRREVRAAAKLTHPNVVVAYDADEVGDTFFLVMEYVAGADLARVLETRGRLPPGEAAGYARQAAPGLQHAHAHGLVHRDVKPSNLLLASDGVVKVLDLGVARFQADGVAGGRLTHEGAIVGTPDYMAPEQADDSSTADGRADIYSLGATLYHLLTGRPPFPGGSIPDKLLRHRQEEPAPIEQFCPEVPPGLAAVVGRMMAKRPVDRYPTPGEVADALAPFADPGGPPIAAPRREPAAAEASTAEHDWPVTQESATHVAKGPLRGFGKKAVALSAGVAAGALALIVFLPPRPVSRPDKEGLAPEGPADVQPADREEKAHPPPVKKEGAAPPIGQAGEPKHLPPLADRPVKPARLLQGHTGTVRCLAYSPCGKFLASGGADKQVLLWDTGTGKQQGLPLRHKHPVRALGWSPDGKALAAGCWGGGYDAAVHLWDTVSGRATQTLAWADKTGTPSKADVRGVAFSPDGRRLASGGGPLRIWDLGQEGGKPSVRQWQETMPSNLYGVAFSPDGNVVAAGCHAKGDDVRVWGADDGEEPTLLRGNEQAFGLAHSDVFAVVGFVAGGKLLVRVTSNGRGAWKTTAGVKVWESDTRARRYTLRDTHEIPGGGIFALAGAADGQLRVAVAVGPPAFGVLAGIDKGESPTEVILWDGDGGKRLSFETDHKGAITSLAFSPDGNHLATGSEDQTVKVWRLTR